MNWSKKGCGCLPGRNFSWKKMKQVAERGYAISSLGGFQDQTGKAPTNVVRSQSWSCSEQEVAVRPPEVPVNPIPWLTIIVFLLWTSSSPNTLSGDFGAEVTRGRETRIVQSIPNFGKPQFYKGHSICFILYSLPRSFKTGFGVFLTPIEHQDDAFMESSLITLSSCSLAAMVSSQPIILCMKQRLLPLYAHHFTIMHT